MKPRTWVVDLRHYIGEDGDFADMPDAAFAVALHMSAIVEWVTLAGAGRELTQTNVPCCRRPGRRRCRGPIVANLDEREDAVVWSCLACHEGGYIHHWQHTLWDRRGESALGRLPSGTTH
ncbi:MAG: hypothetical protein KJ061_20105 [Vicinamibacteraceae bacterium]|nr:hypothetical protein [Vicinamibacteraceae bacterium]